MKQDHCATKVVIIGAGMVGSTAAYASMIKGVCDEIVLVDMNEMREAGEVMDLAHALQFVETGMVRGGDYKDCMGADAIVITAGAAQKPGETRLDLTQKNVKILESILSKLKPNLSSHSVVLLVSNPVDVLTHVARKILRKHDSKKIIGSGTSLDTSRLRYYLSQHFHVHPRSVHAYILGEHGDSEMCAWSAANIASTPLKKFKGYSVRKMNEIFLRTKNAAYEVIKRKGSTYYAIGLVIAELLESILRDERLVTPVSVDPLGKYGLRNVSLGLPSVLGRGGIYDVVELPLNTSEKKLLKKSARQLQSVIKAVGY
jgi:L-lactate dehydrogenase